MQFPSPDVFFLKRLPNEERPYSSKCESKAFWQRVKFPMAPRQSQLRRHRWPPYSQQHRKNLLTQQEILPTEFPSQVKEPPFPSSGYTPPAEIPFCEYSAPWQGPCAQAR